MKHYTVTLRNLRLLYHEGYTTLRNKLDFLQYHCLDPDDEILTFSQQQVEVLKRNLNTNDIELFNKTFIQHEEIPLTSYVKIQMGNLRKLYKIAKDSNIVNLLIKLNFVTQLWYALDTDTHNLTHKEYEELKANLTPHELNTLKQLLESNI